MSADARVSNDKRRQCRRYPFQEIIESDEMNVWESKYLAKLVGGTPEGVPDVYKARSPMIYYADNIVSASSLLVGNKKIGLNLASRDWHSRTQGASRGDL